MKRWKGEDKEKKGGTERSQNRGWEKRKGIGRTTVVGTSFSIKQVINYYYLMIYYCLSHIMQYNTLM